MKRRFSDMVPALLLWALLSIFLWSFVFNFLTDVPQEEKLVLFIDAPLTEETRLAVQLEDVADEHIQMVQVRSFDYAMMSSHEIENADLYIIGESSIAEYGDWFAPLPEALRTGTLLEKDGQPIGVKVYDAASGEGVAVEVIGYAHPSKVVEDHYLLVGKNSLHVQSHEDAVDDEAVNCALALLK
ncbi:MAG: hypothetical protein IJ350_08805 [Clostridia bacterium]|nr:hypothetical protein [Clostridia bacterium]